MPGAARRVFRTRMKPAQPWVLFIFIGFYVAACAFRAGRLHRALAAIFFGFHAIENGDRGVTAGLGPGCDHRTDAAPGAWRRASDHGARHLQPVFGRTVMFGADAHLMQTVMPDASFHRPNGNLATWFAGGGANAIDRLRLRDFWGTDEVVYGLGDAQTWANAGHRCHNAYLNLALTIGIPGIALVIVWVVVLPIVDFCRRSPDPHAGALQTLFLRVCLYGVYASCFESSIFQQVGEVWFFS